MNPRLLIFAVLAPLLLSACGAIPIKVGFCDLKPDARCAVEAVAENTINHWLDSTPEKGRVDLNYVCPDAATCAPPTVGQGEAGDFQLHKFDVPVAGLAPAEVSAVTARALAERCEIPLLVRIEPAVFYRPSP